MRWSELMRYPLLRPGGDERRLVTRGRRNGVVEPELFRAGEVIDERLDGGARQVVEDQRHQRDDRLDSNRLLAGADEVPEEPDARVVAPFHQRVGDPRSGLARPAGERVVPGPVGESRQRPQPLGVDAREVDVLVGRAADP